MLWWVLGRITRPTDCSKHLNDGRSWIRNYSGFSPRRGASAGGVARTNGGDPAGDRGAPPVALAKSAFAIGYQQAELAHQQTTIQHSRSHIQVGHGVRRVTAFVFDAPYQFIEIYAEPGVGALTAPEAEALGAWLADRAMEMKSQKSAGWLGRIFRRKQDRVPSD
jgi:hypothetical protein